MKLGYFSKDFLKDISSDPLRALVQFYTEFLRFNSSYENDGLRYGDVEYFLECVGMCKALGTARGIEIGFPTLSGNRNEQMGQILKTFDLLGNTWMQDYNKRTADAIIADAQSEYIGIFAGETAYEFSADDLKRVQTLVNELRGKISESKLITDDHKRRLLRRLEALQKEIHKGTSDIDRFWGFVAEAGIVARKFGEDMKPITDLVTELSNIVFRAILIKEGIHQLPNITSPPALPAPSATPAQTPATSTEIFT